MFILFQIVILLYIVSTETKVMRPSRRDTRFVFLKLFLKLSLNKISENVRQSFNLSIDIFKICSSIKYFSFQWFQRKFNGRGISTFIFSKDSPVVLSRIWRKQSQHHLDICQLPRQISWLSGDISAKSRLIFNILKENIVSSPSTITD